MKSSKPGKGTLDVKVEQISKAGVCLLIKCKEYFLSHDDFPWFKGATVAEILNVKLLHGEHLHWPDLDVDLELESLAKPKKYPLIFRKTGLSRVADKRRR